jgi:serine/threonine-protein kinase
MAALHRTSRTLLWAVVLVLGAGLAGCAQPSVIVVNPTPTVAPAAADASPAVPATRSVSAPTQPTGDLGLSTPMSSPSCDGSTIVVVGNVTDAPWASQVREQLADHPGARYLRTDRSCSTLRQATETGNPIYAAYYGPFTDVSTACSVKANAGGDAYVKTMDQATSPSSSITC